MNKTAAAIIRQGPLPTSPNDLLSMGETPATEQKSQREGQLSLTEILDEIEACANAATPEPWIAERKSFGDYLYLLFATDSNRKLTKMIASNCRDEGQDLIFAAAARSDVPALVKLSRQQTKTLEGIRSLLERQPLGCLGDGHDNGGNVWPIRDEVIYNINKALSAQLLSEQTRRAADSVPSPSKREPASE